MSWTQLEHRFLRMLVETSRSCSHFSPLSNSSGKCIELYYIHDSIYDQYSYDIWLTSCSVSLWTSRWMLVFSFQHHQVYDWIFEVESMKIIEIQVLQHPSKLFVLGAYKASWSIEMTCQVEHARFSCPICLEQASRDCWLLHGVNMLCIFHQAMCVSGS